MLWRSETLLLHAAHLRIQSEEGWSSLADTFGGALLEVKA